VISGHSHLAKSLRLHHLRIRHLQVSAWSLHPRQECIRPPFPQQGWCQRHWIRRKNLRRASAYNRREKDFHLLILLSRITPVTEERTFRYKYFTLYKQYDVSCMAMYLSYHSSVANESIPIPIFINNIISFKHHEIYTI
jgi:hypothetical protein